MEIPPRPGAKSTSRPSGDKEPEPRKAEALERRAAKNTKKANEQLRKVLSRRRRESGNESVLPVLLSRARCCFVGLGANRNPDNLSDSLTSEVENLKKGSNLKAETKFALIIQLAI